MLRIDDYLLIGMLRIIQNLLLCLNVCLEYDINQFKVLCLIYITNSQCFLRYWLYVKVIDLLLVLEVNIINVFL